MLRAMPVNARSSLDLEIMITPFVLVRSGCIKRVFSMRLRRSRMWKQAEHRRSADAAPRQAVGEWDQGPIPSRVGRGQTGRMSSRGLLALIAVALTALASPAAAQKAKAADEDTLLARVAAPWTGDL